MLRQAPAPLWGGSNDTRYEREIAVSVLKNKRGLSQLEFYHNARELRKELTKLLVREFGLKKDNDTLAWVIEQFRNNITALLRDIMWNITAANTIYPVSREELETRRYYQNKAIIACEELFQELQYCNDVLPVKVSLFIPYIDRIQTEIRLLKGWRKSNTQLAKRLGCN
jgi:hypothetical protein